MTTSGVATWVAEMTADRSASTVRKALGVLRAVLDLAVADRRLTVNPASGVSQPRLPLQEMSWLSADELEHVAEAMGNQRDLVLTMLLGWTGLRVGEALALERHDVDLLRRRIRITRNVTEVGGELLRGSPE